MNKWLRTLTPTLVSSGALVALLMLNGAAYAQTTPAPAAPAAAAPAAPAAPAAEPPPQFLGMDFTSFADVGFSDFTTGKGTFVGGGHARTFDWENGAVSVQSVDVQLQKTPDSGFGGLIDLTIGKDADTIHSYGTVDTNKGPYFADVAADGTKPSQTYFDPTQLYAYYGMGAANVIFGKFATHAGQEVIKSRDDTNFSRSILFGFAIPFTHTGLRATFKPSDSLALLVGANEGWDTVTDKNKDVTGEFGWEWSPAKAFSFFGTYLSGKEKLVNYPKAAFDADSTTATRNLVDLIFTYNATDSLSLVLNYDNGSQEKSSLFNGKTATWSGEALYVNYGINDDWRISVLGESFSDTDGARIGVVEPGKTTGPTWSEGTFTVAYMGIKKIELRGELRSDSADQKIFSDAKGEKAINSMTSIGLEGIYKF